MTLVKCWNPLKSANRPLNYRLLMDILYKVDPVKIMNLRIDSLSQILNMVNIQR